jgi:hypothetical protein
MHSSADYSLVLPHCLCSKTLKADPRAKAAEKKKKAAAAGSGSDTSGAAAKRKPRAKKSKGTEVGIGSVGEASSGSGTEATSPRAAGSKRAAATKSRSKGRGSKATGTTASVGDNSDQEELVSGKGKKRKTQQKPSATSRGRGKAGGDLVGSSLLSPIQESPAGSSGEDGVLVGRAQLLGLPHATPKSSARPRKRATAAPAAPAATAAEQGTGMDGNIIPSGKTRRKKSAAMELDLSEGSVTSGSEGSGSKKRRTSKTVTVAATISTTSGSEGSGSQKRRGRKAGTGAGTGVEGTTAGTSSWDPAVAPPPPGPAITSPSAASRRRKAATGGTKGGAGDAGTAGGKAQARKGGKSAAGSQPMACISLLSSSDSEGPSHLPSHALPARLPQGGGRHPQTLGFGNTDNVCQPAPPTVAHFTLWPPPVAPSLAEGASLSGQLPLSSVQRGVGRGGIAEAQGGATVAGLPHATGRDTVLQGVDVQGRIPAASVPQALEEEPLPLAERLKRRRQAMTSTALASAEQVCGPACSAQTQCCVGTIQGSAKQTTWVSVRAYTLQRTW